MRKSKAHVDELSKASLNVANFETVVMILLRSTMWLILIFTFDWINLISGQAVSGGCYYDLRDEPTMKYAANPGYPVTPATCFYSCSRMNAFSEGKSITVGLTMGGICQCAEGRASEGILLIRARQ